MQKAIHLAIKVGLWIGVIYTAGFILWAGEPDNGWWWFGFLLFFSIGCLPYAVMYRFAKLNSDTVLPLSVLLLTTVIITGGGFFMVWQAFVINPGALSGVIFFILPVYQLVVAALGMILSNWVKASQKKRSIARAP